MTSDSPRDTASNEACSEAAVSGFSLVGTIGCLLSHQDDAVTLFDNLKSSIEPAKRIASCFTSPTVTASSVEDLEASFEAQGLFGGEKGARLRDLLKFAKENLPAFLEIIKLISLLG